MADPFVAKLGLETEIRVFNDPSYESIPWATAITMPGIQFDIVDVTTNTSPNGFREKIPGLADGGEVTFTLNYHDDETTHMLLWTLQQARELGSFQIAMPQFETNNLFDFDAYVTGLPINSPIDSQVTQDVTLTITGNIEKSTE
jgi:predicted secreted protein